VGPDFVPVRAPVRIDRRKSVNRFGLAAALVREVGGEDEADAASFEAGNAVGEGGDSSRMRMADGDGGAVAQGVARRQVELREDRFTRLCIVEEDLARGRADTCILSAVVRYGRCRGAAVDEKRLRSRSTGIRACISAGSAVAREPW